MNSTEILNALEKERELLEHFICLSEEQLLLLAEGDLDGFDELLMRRADIMSELTEMEEALSMWILLIVDDFRVPEEMMDRIRSVNDEIVRMVNHIVRLDEQAHAALESMNLRTSAELRSVARGRQALEQYASTYMPPPDPDLYE